MFPVKATAVVFDLECRPADGGRSQLEVLKDAVLSGVQRMESDDRFYVYSSAGELAMCETIGQAVAVVSDHQDERPVMHTALRECLWLVRQHDPAHRAVFLFSNRYKGTTDTLEEVTTPGPFDPASEVFLYQIGRTSPAHNSKLIRVRHCLTASAAARCFSADFSPLLVDR